MERFEKKDYRTKIGMIGELLSHVIFIRYNDNFNSINPFFNMEEKSITKGFDLLLVDEENENKLWITEVKSGELASMNNSNKKNKNLLSVAKSDLKKRLNSNENHIWHNAINGASISMRKGDLKDAIIDILEDSLEDSYKNISISKNKNVIISSVLFNDINDMIDLESLENFHSKTISDDLFSDLIVFSIHKKTYEKVVKFLKSEVEK